MIMFLLGCADGGDAEPADTSGFNSVDCDDSVSATVEPTAIATAPRIRFTTDEDVPARVVFENGDGTERYSDPDSGGTEHERVLVGILPEVAFSFRVEIDDGDGYRCVAQGVGENGALPGGLPEWSMDVADASSVAPGMNLLPMISSDGIPEHWLVIVDESGRAVWAWSPSREANAVLTTRAWLSRDRQGVLYNSGALSADGPSSFGKVAFDGTWTVVATVEGAHTDFVELPDGRIAYIGWELREFDGQRLLGDHVSTVDESGLVQTLWRSFDNVEVDLTNEWSTGFYVPDPSVGDWSHVNGISVDDESGDIFVTMTVWDGIARIDGTTGEQEWFLGNSWGDFSTQGTSALTALPHWVQWLGDDEILVFNRSDPRNPNSCSWAAEIQLDEGAHTATTVRDFTGTDSCTLVTFFGAAERLANGNTMIDWSSAGRLDEVSADNKTVWSLSLDVGAALGFTSRIQPYPE